MVTWHVVMQSPRYAGCDKARRLMMTVPMSMSMRRVRRAGRALGFSLNLG